MINVSQDYLDNIYLDTTQTKCKARLELTDVDINDVTYSIYNVASWCSVDNVRVDSNPRKSNNTRT